MNSKIKDVLAISIGVLGVVGILLQRQVAFRWQEAALDAFEQLETCDEQLTEYREVADEAVNLARKTSDLLHACENRD